MIEWIRSLCRRKAIEPSGLNGSSSEHELSTQFRQFLAQRMIEFRDPIHLAFSELLNSSLTEEVVSLHLEVFLDEPGFSINLFSYDKAMTEIGGQPAVDRFNTKLKSLWPIIAQDEFDKFMIWETDPKWDRQIALVQPADELDIPAMVIPWLKEIVSSSRGNFVKKISVAVHDFPIEDVL